MPSWITLLLRIIFGIILAVIGAGAGLFGYIAWKARARKWSGGMFTIVIISLLLLYRFILNNPWSLLPF